MKEISRREFLRLGSTVLSAMTAGAYLPATTDWSVEELRSPEIISRVTTSYINLYTEPDFNSKRIGKLKKDSLLLVFDQVNALSIWSRNPRWYRLMDGYIHSAYTQRVEKAHLNRPLSSIPEGGQLGEITVPYVQSQRRDRRGRWKPLYRLYYESVHWITNMENGPDGELWYAIKDERLRVIHHVPAQCVRPIPKEELAPISPDIPAEEKRIGISLEQQRLRAFEMGNMVLDTEISSGITSRGKPSNGIPTDTPDGHFRIQVKMPSRHMGNGILTSNIYAYELPGVPWASFFHSAGIALHGTYWHDNFGHKMSHGCINMRNEDAKWIYRWSLPSASPKEWRISGSGTRIHII